MARPHLISPRRGVTCGNVGHDPADHPATGRVTGIGSLSEPGSEYVMSSTHSSITKVDTLHLADISAMDSAEVNKFIAGARTAMKTAEKGRVNATDRAAYATWMAEHVLGIIGQDNKPGKDDVDPGWITDEAWAATFDKVKSNAGYWRTLGKVMVTLNLDRENETYIRFRTSNLYQKPDAKAIVNADDTTPENIEERLVAYMADKVDQYGKALKKTRAPGKTAAEKGEDKAKSLTESIEAIPGDDVAKAKVLVAALSIVCGRLDVDGWHEVDTEAIEALRTAMNDKFAAEVSIAS